jgi:hypothetical protein
LIADKVRVSSGVCIHFESRLSAEPRDKFHARSVMGEAAMEQVSFKFLRFLLPNILPSLFRNNLSPPLEEIHGFLNATHQLLNRLRWNSMRDCRWISLFQFLSKHNNPER